LKELMAYLRWVERLLSRRCGRQPCGASLVPLDLTPISYIM